MIFALAKAEKKISTQSNGAAQSFTEIIIKFSVKLCVALLLCVEKGKPISFFHSLLVVHNFDSEITRNKIRIVTSVIDVKIHQVKMKIGKSKGYVNGEKIAGASEEFELPIDTKNVGIPVSIKIVGVIKGKEIGKESDVVEILYMSKNDSRK